MAEELHYFIKVANGDSIKVLESASTKEKWVMQEKAERNSLLAKSDSMMVSDRGLSESKLKEWKTYRQSLRDFDFSTYEIDDEIIWPTKPS